jgi:hypothetical protein
MSLTIVLAAALDSSLLEKQISVWQSAGCMIKSAGSIRGTIVHFNAGISIASTWADPSPPIAGD